MVHLDDGAAESERLRRALYRADASDATLVRYADAAASKDVIAERDVKELRGGKDQQSNPLFGSRRGRAVTAAAVSVLAILAIAGLSTGLKQTAETPVAGPSSSAVAVKRAAVTAQDVGPQLYARGAASRVEQGHYRYTVASGDTAIGIASRFHVCVADVTSGIPSGVDNGALPPGTVIAIELDSWEVHTDGTVSCDSSSRRQTDVSRAGL